MRPVTMKGDMRRGGRAWLGLCIALASVAAPIAGAKPPLEPLPAPVFSFDSNSPWIMSSAVAAADVVSMGPNTPTVVITHTALGANTLLDDLDGLSAANASVGPLDVFALLFSVDRETMGVAPVDQDLLAAGIPFNAADQAWRGQAAGDQFMSLQMFTRSGPLLITRGVQNSALVRNNFDEGGTDFMAQPETAAQDYTASRRDRVPQDNVDAAALLDRLSPGGPVINMYFTLTAGSPSLPTLPGGATPSGANIFFNAEPGALPTTLYASCYDLGLQPGDDIDALMVFDTNQNGLYDTGDQVVFSLTPVSPSLILIAGASQIGPAADLFTVSLGQAPALFAPAAMLGLGAPADNIDALDLLVCPNSFACAMQHGIRSFRADVNCDHVISYADINPFVLALGDRSLFETRYPYCNWYNADCNGDGVVSYADINVFVQMVSGGPP